MRDDDFVAWQENQAIRDAAMQKQIDALASRITQLEKNQYAKPMTKAEVLEECPHCHSGYSKKCTCCDSCQVKCAEDI